MLRDECVVRRVHIQLRHVQGLAMKQSVLEARDEAREGLHAQQGPKHATKQGRDDRVLVCLAACEEARETARQDVQVENRGG